MTTEFITDARRLEQISAALAFLDGQGQLPPDVWSLSWTADPTGSAIVEAMTEAHKKLFWRVIRSRLRRNFLDESAAIVQKYGIGTPVITGGNTT